jgi:hypothetical protein
MTEQEALQILGRNHGRAPTPSTMPIIGRKATPDNWRTQLTQERHARAKRKAQVVRHSTHPSVPSVGAGRTAPLCRPSPRPRRQRQRRWAQSTVRFLGLKGVLALLIRGSALSR